MTSIPRKTDIPHKTNKAGKILIHLLLTFLALGLTLTTAAEEIDFVETFSLSADGRVSLDNVNGDVTIEAWDSNEVKVEYTKRARSQAGLDRMTVEFDVQGDRLEIETEYSKEKRSWKNNDGGEVEFHLWVPRGARLDEIDLVNGNLKVTGVEGDLRADLVNGTVRARGLRGDVEIDTVNGDVEITMTDLASNRSVVIDSVNGSIEVAIPDGVGADIEASTVHGKISNDFGLTVKKGRYVGRSLNASMGGGGAQIELDNVNGAIRIVSQ